MRVGKREILGDLSVGGDTIFSDDLDQRDVDRLEDNILLLGFYRAVDNSKIIYNLQDSFVDEYQDESGVRAEYTKAIIHFDGDEQDNAFTEVTGKTITNTEAYDSYTKLMLHLNNNVTDSATAKVVTNNNVTFQVYYTQTKLYGSYFNGSSAYLSIPDSDDFYFGTGDFTIDLWINFVTTPTTAQFIMGQRADANNHWELYWGGSGFQMSFTSGGVNKGSYYTTTSMDCSVSQQMVHLAFIRSGSNAYIFINGKSQSLDTNVAFSTNDLGNIASALEIGRKMDGTYYLNGYVDEIRISKGIARWTTDFVPYMTPYGKVGILSRDSKIGSSCAEFHGSGDYLSLADSDDFYFGTGDFTIEFWTKLHSGDTEANPMLVSQFANAGNDRMVITLTGSGDNIWFFLCIGGVTKASYAFQSNYGFQKNLWYHLAFERYGSTAKIFVNGISQTLTETVAFGTNDVGNISAPLTIGARSDNAYYFNGWIDEFRVSKGIARYTADFTPSLVQFDYEKYYNSTDDYYQTTQSYSPDATTGQQFWCSDLGNVGISSDQYKFGSSSIYFGGGSNDYIFTKLNNKGLLFEFDKFTIDFWVRFSDISTSRALFGWTHDTSNYLAFYYNQTSNKLCFKQYTFATTDIEFDCAFTPSTNTWYHIAIVRNGLTSGDHYIFVDGVSKSLTLQGGAWSASLRADRQFSPGRPYPYFYIGKSVQGSILNGYIDEFRVSKGIARWTSGFSVPTSAYTIDEYTKLLLHGEWTLNPSWIIDDTGKAVTRNGDAKTSVTQYKFGTASCAFDGTGDYLSLADSADWDFGSGDFTIDFWVRFNASASVYLYAQRADANNRIDIETGSSNSTITFIAVDSGVAKAQYTATFSPALNTWYHMAFVRNGSNFYIFKDGVSLSLTVTTPISTNTLPNVANPITIGSCDTDPASMNGYIDEFRISKGIARWTTGFDVPTARYDVDSYTKLLLHFDYSRTLIQNECGEFYSDSKNNKTSARAICDNSFLNGEDFWIATNYNTNQWACVKFNLPKVITKIRLQNGYASYPTRGIKQAKLEASNDGVTWTKIPAITWDGVYATQYNTDEIQFAQPGTTDLWAVVTFSNSTAYSYYRIYGYNNWGESHMSINEVEFIEYSARDLNILSTTQVAESVPTEARMVLFEEDVDSVTLNTDLKAYLSRDNGTTWSQVTLVDEGNYDSNKQILVGTVDLSSQPSGTNIKYKITSHNNKNLKITGVGVNWD